MESDEEESKGEDEADDEEIDSDDEILGGGMDDMDIFKRKKNETNRQTAKKIEKTEEANGKAVLSQIEIYEQFVKIRIQLQKLMQAAALLPKMQQIIEFNQRADLNTKKVRDIGINR